MSEDSISSLAMLEMKTKVYDYATLINDKRKIKDVQDELLILSLKYSKISAGLSEQIHRDIIAQYKFWDALCMWLSGFAKPLNDGSENRELIMDIASNYVTGNI